MRLAQRAPEAVLVAGREDQVHVVGHQAIGPDLDARVGAMGGEKLAIEPVVLVAEERLQPAVAPLRDVVGMPRNHDSCQTCHDLSPSRNRIDES